MEVLRDKEKRIIRNVVRSVRSITIPNINVYRHADDWRMDVTTQFRILDTIENGVIKIIKTRK